MAVVTASAPAKLAKGPEYVTELVKRSGESKKGAERRRRSNVPSDAGGGGELLPSPEDEADAWSEKERRCDTNESPAALPRFERRLAAFSAWNGAIGARPF